METTRQPARPGWEHRLHAVLALLGGEPVPQVTTRFGMGRSVLYKWRHRALQALQRALSQILLKGARKGQVPIGANLRYFPQ